MMGKWVLFLHKSDIHEIDREISSDDDSSLAV